MAAADVLASPPPPCSRVVPEDLGAEPWWWSPDLDGSCEPVYSWVETIELVAHLRSVVLAIGALCIMVGVALLVVTALRGRS